MKNRGKLNSIVNRGSKVVGVIQTGRNQLYESRAKRTSTEITSDLIHIPSQYYNVLLPGRRIRAFRAKNAKTLSSFIPMSIKVINKT